MNPLIQRKTIRPLLITLTLICFALLPSLKAADCPTACGSGGNTAVGVNALDSVTTGTNNTAVGTGALTDDTTGPANVAVGNGALAKNTTGQQNMAVGAEALANNITGNFNMGIGFRALFMNTGSRNSAVGAAALRHNAGASDNTAIGSTAMRENTTGVNNTAIGSGALQSNTNGGGNTANGAFALISNNHGSNNSAFGELALESNTAGTFNTALGQGALATNTLGNNNTASGAGALFSNFIGVNNTATGFQALNDNSGGFQNTAVGSQALKNSHGNLNVALGYNAGLNVTSANNVISIGSLGMNIDNTCWIQNIFGVATQSLTVMPVLVSNNGQLGTLTSSRRFKHDIKPMDKASDAILALKPVTFHYNNDKTNTPQFGLVAEDVAEVNPDLVVRDNKGDINTVRYEAVNAMLLNEFLKARRQIDAQQKQIDALTAAVQKVSAQLEVSKAAPQTVLNNQ